MWWFEVLDCAVLKEIVGERSLNVVEQPVHSTTELVRRSIMNSHRDAHLEKRSGTKEKSYAQKLAVILRI